jgi:signal transduction histidine kinase/ActR/RegA family two-component response regulator
MPSTLRITDLFLLSYTHHPTLLGLIAGILLGTIAAWLASTVIIRKLKHRNSQLRFQLDQQSRLTDEALRAKSFFLTNMSHEIRTPMNGIMGMTSLLDTTSLNKEQRGYIDTIRSCGESLLTVMNNIFDFSAIESGQLSLEEKATDVRTCVNSVLDMFMARTINADILFQANIADEVPARVFTDSHRLRQVLINIVGNAVKFTKKGEIGIRVFLSPVLQSPAASVGQVQLVFEIKDTGIGILPSQTSRLFQPFAQVDSSVTRKYGGIGLGLPISQRLIELMNGRISVDSQPGQGATFTFTIMARPVPVRSNTPAAPDIPPLAGKYPLRILLAEDNPINQQLALNILSKMGYCPTVAANGKEVLEHIKKNSFDLIFMDVQMPEMDGLEATRRIRSANGTQPVIIAITANVTRQDREECLSEGMNDYLSKPVDLDQLTHMLEKWGQQITSLAS